MTTAIVVILGGALLVYIGYEWGRENSRNEVEDALWAVAHAEAEANTHDAARKVALSALAAEVRAHDRTRAAWRDERAGATPLFDMLSERRDGFEWTAEEIRGLPEVGA